MKFVRKQKAPPAKSPLADDLLPNIQAIAEHAFGEANKTTIRRVRHLIAQHGFPAKKVGGRYQASRAVIDAWYRDHFR